MNDLNHIKTKLKVLQDFKERIEKQQLNYPVDRQSMDTIRGLGFYYVGFVEPLSLATPYDESSEIQTNGKKYLLDTGSFVDIGI